ncbi:MAG: YceI family protein [Candidatus Omnitrophota bacterium]
MSVPNISNIFLISAFVLNLNFFGGPALAQGQEKWQVIPQQSKVQFIFHSTLHHTRGDALVSIEQWEELKGSMNARFVFPVRELKTYNKMRDRKMYAMFEIEKYPDIIYQMKGLSLNKETGTADLDGELTIHGVTNHFPVSAAFEQTDAGLRFKGSAVVMLSDFELEAPGFLFLTVKDNVDVVFDINIKY